MKSNALNKIVLLALLVVVGIGTFGLMRLDNARLRKGISQIRPGNEQVAGLREDNRRTHELIARMQAGETEGARVIHAELVRARGEVAELEKRAWEKHAQRVAQNAADAAALATNRDPEKGLVWLENFSDTGQATPAAAFQTLVWAAMKGEDNKLAGLIAFPGTTREKAEAVVAGLPEADRAKYSTPEKLAALFFADTFTSIAAAEIVGVSLPDLQHAVVRVRVFTGKEEKIPLQLGPNGWQIVMPEAMVGKLEGWARNATRLAEK